MTVQRHPPLWLIFLTCPWIGGWGVIAFSSPAVAYSRHASERHRIENRRPDDSFLAATQRRHRRAITVQGEPEENGTSPLRSNQAAVSRGVASDPDNSLLASCLSDTSFKQCGKKRRSPSSQSHVYVPEELTRSAVDYAQAPLLDTPGRPDQPADGQMESLSESTLDLETHPTVDPDLGILRLIELPVESVEILDPELGVLRLQEVPLASDPADPSVYLQVYSNFFWTDNVLSVVDDPIDDGIVQLGVSLSAIPALGDRTYLISSASGDLVRYTDETNLDYNDISFNLGVYHAFTRRSYLELGWNNDQFFDRQTGDRFLNDHSFYVSVGRRDRLSSRLSLDTEYELEYNLSDPVERNRAINELRASLEYQITPTLETDLSYRFNLIDFTKQDRNDFYHQVILGVNYDLSRETRISFFGGGRFGDSSERFLDFDSALLGVSISVNIPLF